MNRPGTPRSPRSPLTIVLRSGSLTGRADGPFSPAEAARADAFVHEADRTRFLAGRTLLRTVLGEEAGIPPTDVRLRERTGRAPAWERSTGSVPCSFSLARARTHAVVALARGGSAVGVDVEPLPTTQGDRPMPASTGAEFALIATPAEQEAVAAAPPESREVLFRQLWTRKEAVVKADGRGLEIDPRAVSVGIPRAGGDWTPVRLPGGGRFLVRSLEWPADHLTAVALPDPGDAAMPEIELVPSADAAGR